MYTFYMHYLCIPWIKCGKWRTCTNVFASVPQSHHLHCNLLWLRSQDPEEPSGQGRIQVPTFGEAKPLDKTYNFFLWPSKTRGVWVHVPPEEMLFYYNIKKKYYKQYFGGLMNLFGGGLQPTSGQHLEVSGDTGPTGSKDLTHPSQNRTTLLFC